MLPLLPRVQVEKKIIILSNLSHKKLSKVALYIQKWHYFILVIKEKTGLKIEMHRKLRRNSLVPRGRAAQSFLTKNPFQSYLTDLSIEVGAKKAIFLLCSLKE